MDEQLQAILNNLMTTQFADLKGSWANLQVQLPEKLLNEIVTAVLASQKGSSPWLALVNAVRVKGSDSQRPQTRLPRERLL